MKCVINNVSSVFLRTFVAEMGNANLVNGSFTLKDVPIENQRPLKVRVVGAGFSGILAAIR